MVSLVYKDTGIYYFLYFTFIYFNRLDLKMHTNSEDRMLPKLKKKKKSISNGGVLR